MEEASRNRMACLLILGFSAVLGFICVVQMYRSPFGPVPIIDEKSYVEWGRAIAAGDIIGRKVFYQAPLYPYFLGFCFWLSKGSLLFARFVQAGFGVATVLIVYLLGRRLFGPREGLLAALILALYGVFYFYMTILVKASLVITFSALSCWLAVLASDIDKTRYWLALGVSLGLLTLLRGNFLLLVPGAMVWAFLIKGSFPGRPRIFRALLILAGVAAAVAPVTARNWYLNKELVLTTSQGGQNFYIGNGPYANGSYAYVPFVRPDPLWEGADFLAEARRRTGRLLKPAEASRFWYRESIKHIINNPEKAGRLQLHKMRLMLHAYEIPDNYNYTFMRQNFMPGLWFGFMGYGYLMGPALLGMVFSVRRNSRTWYLIMFSVLYTLSVVAFFVVSRYRVPLVPVLAVFSAYFVFRVLDWIKAKDKRYLLLCAVVLVITTIFVYLPTPESKTSYAVSYNLTGAAFNRQGKYDLAVEYLQKAVDLEPDSYQALYNLGLALLNRGDPAGALEYFQKADRLKPGDQLILEHLAAASWMGGDCRQARQYYDQAVSKGGLWGLNVSAQFRQALVGRCPEPQKAPIEP